MPPDRVFAWHEHPGAFARLTPPWEAAEVVERTGTIRDGDVAVLKMRAGPWPVKWEAHHIDYQPGRQFRDEQKSGPFSHWSQLHRVNDDGEGGALVEDVIDYALPAGALGRAVGEGWLHGRLRKLFAYRYFTLASDLAWHARHDGRPLRVAIAGSTGYIGRALAAFLSTGGHEVIRLLRPRSADHGDAVGRAVLWDPHAQTIDEKGLGPVDAIVNLVGESIAGGRWTPERKRRMWESRVQSTQFLADFVARAPEPPRVLINASAVGFYGDRGQADVDENSEKGIGWLADLSGAWEDATKPALAAGVRVVLPRIAPLLTPAGGPLGKMLPFFRAGLGGRMGTGKQPMPWIVLDDLLGLLHQSLFDDRLSGPINATAPGLVSNGEFADALARMVNRPAFFPVPSFALKAAVGEMAWTVLGGARVRPRRLQDLNFPFRFPRMEGALAHLLGKGPLPAFRERADGTAVDYGQIGV
jgi:hypothetical protein